MKILLTLFSVLFSLGLNASEIQIQVDQLQPQGTEYHTYDFGPVRVGSRAMVRYRVVNTGVTPLTFRDAYVYGMDFRAHHNCQGILLPQDRCFFEVTYWPYFEGFASGNFILSFNENSAIDLRLYGRGVRY